MLAARDNANPKVITALLQLGIDPKAKSDSGYMAIDYAKDNTKLINTEVFQSLEKLSY
jgi:hypothetical protein